MLFKYVTKGIHWSSKACGQPSSELQILHNNILNWYADLVPVWSTFCPYLVSNSLLSHITHSNSALQRQFQYVHVFGTGNKDSAVVTLSVYTHFVTELCCEFFFHITCKQYL